MSKFLKGDLVELNSGGPVMTVNNLATHEGDTRYECVWFKKGGDKQEKGLFSEEALKKYEKSAMEEMLD